MKLAFANIKGYGLNLLIDGKPEFEVLPYDHRVRCLRNANKRFDHDIMQAASLYPNEETGAFLWCYTSVFLRGENITDLVRLYFLLEVIYELESKNDKLILEIRFPVPRAAIAELKDKNILFTYNYLSYAYGIIYKVAGWLKRFVISINKNLKHVLKSANKTFRGNLLDVNKSPRQNRLDKLGNYQFYEPYKVYSGQEHILEGFDADKMVEFRNELTLKDLSSTIAKTTQINKFINKNKAKLSPIYFSYLYSRCNSELWSLLLYKKSVEKFFNKCRITNLVHVSTLTKPEYRVLWAEAKKNGVKIISVSSRTLKTLSSSERLLACDYQAYSGACLPDYFIVRDEFSRGIFAQNESFLERSCIGGRQTSAEIPKRKDKTDQKEWAVLLMLTHQKQSSKKLLSDVAASNLAEAGISKIIYRSHPAYIFNSDEIKSHFPGAVIIDNHKQKPEDLLDFNTIMISGPTTGALEFARFCRGLIWLPYIWSDGILFDDLMSNLGVKAINKDELRLILRNNFNHERGLSQNNIENVSQKFQSNKLISNHLFRILQSGEV